MTHSPTPKKGPLLVIFMTVLMDLIGFGMIIPLVSLYGKELGATAFELGLLGAIYSIMQFVFAPIWGALSDRYGRRPILLTSLIGSTLSYAGFGISHTFWVLFLTRAFAGFFAANISAAQAAIADVTEPKDRARGMGLIGAAFGIGFTLGPPLGGIAAAKISLQAPGFIAATLCGLNALLAYFQLPETLSIDYRRQAQKNKFKFSPFSPELIKSLKNSSLLQQLISTFFFWTLAFSMMEQTFALMIQQKFSLDTHEAAYQTGLLLMTSGILGAILQGLLIRKIVPRFGESRLLIIGFFFSTAGIALLPRMPTFSSELIAILFLAIGSSLINPCLSAMISQNAHSQHQGGTLGVTQGFGSLARAIGPMFGLIFFSYGMSYPFTIAAVIAASLGIFMKIKKFSVVLLAFIFIHSISEASEFTLLQINDVYEIAPLVDGKVGGLARVKTIKDQALTKNSNTLLILAGDFLNPSALGTALVDGQKLAGKQMIDVLNEVGLDYAVFGNHEFDLKQTELAERIAESKFRWIAGNVRTPEDQPFAGLPESRVHTFEIGGEKIRMGIVALTLSSNQKPFVKYRDPFVSVREQLASLKDKSDFIIAITHQKIEDDIRLAKEFPELRLILGGHEHIKTYVQQDSNLAPIAKADANAKTIYEHQLQYDSSTHKVEIKSKIIDVHENIKENPTIKARVESWIKKAYSGFSSVGLNPSRLVTFLKKPYNGLDEHTRSRQTDLGAWINQAMLKECSVKKAKISFFNSGSIRIDDQVGPGAITEYDLIRILPFGNSVVCATVLGKDLKNFLDFGLKKSATGEYMQYLNVEKKENNWFFNKKAIQDQDKLSIATSSYVIDTLKLPIEPDSRLDTVDMRLSIIHLYTKNKSKRLESH